MKKLKKLTIKEKKQSIKLKDNDIDIVQMSEYGQDHPVYSD